MKVKIVLYLSLESSEEFGGDNIGKHYRWVRGLRVRKWLPLDMTIRETMFSADNLERLSISSKCR